MNLWIVLFSFLMSPLDASAASSPELVSMPMVRVGAPALTPDSPMRYRGIEQLLAKFEAEAEAGQDI